MEYPGKYRNIPLRTRMSICSCLLLIKSIKFIYMHIHMADLHPPISVKAINFRRFGVHGFFLSVSRWACQCVNHIAVRAKCCFLNASRRSTSLSLEFLFLPIPELSNNSQFSCRSIGLPWMANREKNRVNTPFGVLAILEKYIYSNCNDFSTSQFHIVV